jgi:hypothetical protein
LLQRRRVERSCSSGSSGALGLRRQAAVLAPFTEEFEVAGSSGLRRRAAPIRGAGGGRRGDRPSACDRPWEIGGLIARRRHDSGLRVIEPVMSRLGYRDWPADRSRFAEWKSRSDGRTRRSRPGWWRRRRIPVSASVRRRRAAAQAARRYPDIGLRRHQCEDAENNTEGRETRALRVVTQLQHRYAHATLHMRSNPSTSVQSIFFVGIEFRLRGS